MKSLHGLRWALQSARPRHVPFNTTPGTRVNFLTSKNPKTPGEVPNSQLNHKKADERPVEPPKPAQHVLSQPMRAMMRQLPHPVVVITTLENTRELSEPEDMRSDQFPRPIPRAMTVSSFTSLSIDPIPRVTFNVTLPSTTYSALVKRSGFNAHILSGDDHGARIADLFTRGNRPSADTETPKGRNEQDLGVLAGLEKLGVQIVGREAWQREWEQAGEYRHNVFAASKAGSPITDVELPPSGTLPLLQGQGIMYVLKCEYRKLTPPVDGDFDHHAIVMGEVMDIVPGESGNQGGVALAYADRAYRRMGKKLLERPTN
ncbi:flavin reductase like domain-containing protein [Hypoxylon crocopeplum]|nr:flavin reductase like domain-containing protein [Hypoxylon crocopeplum]